MMPITTGQAAAGFLKYLAEPAARSLALGCLAGIALAAFRVKRVPLRLLVWTTTLYAALAMPFLGAILPRIAFPVPAQAAVVVQNVGQRLAQSFRRDDVTMASAEPTPEAEASRQLRQTTPQPFFHQGKRDPSKLRASVSYKNGPREDAGASALTKGATTNRRGDMKAMSASAKSSQSASARRERQEAVTMAVAKPNAEQETSRQLRQTALQPFFHQGKRDPSKLRASVSHKNSQTAAGRGGGEPGDISRRATGVTREAILPMTQTSRAQKGFSIPWMAVGLGIYFAVTMLFLARLLLGMFLSWRLERASEEIHEREAIRLVRMRACMGGLENTPRLAETKMLSVPATMGVLHPVILLPTDWRKWDEAKLDAIVAHEVSHVARRDALTQRLSLIHRAIFWFSPLAWWMDRQITELAEEASDEAALAGGADQARYAETLLGFFAELEAAPGRIHWEGISMANGCRAERRVERILSWKGTNSMKKWLAVMIVAVAAPLVFVAGSAHPLLAQQDKAPKKAHNTIKPGGPVAPALPAAPSVGVVAPAPVTPAPTTPGIVSPALAAAPEPGPGVGEFTPGPAPQALSATPVGASAPMIAPVPGAPEHPPIVPGPIANGPVAPADLALAGPVVRVASPTPNVGVGVYYGNGIRTGVGVGRIASAAPVAVVAGTQSETPRARYEYGYGYSNDGPRYVMMAGDSESVTMSGSEEDIEHAQRLRKKMGGGDLIWFERDEKSYVITDPAFIAKAKALFAPEEALGKQQEVLGSQQEALGKQQEALGDQMEDVKAKIRDITPELEQVRARLKELQSTGATQRELGRLQSELGQLQREVGRSQSQAGAGQGDIGRQQGELGRKQGELGRRQGELGRQQGELARKASRELRGMFDDAVAKGIAKPE